MNYKPETKNHLVVILLGPPGSGKGTQANLLTDKLNLYCFETSKVGEEKINQAKPGDYITVGGKKYYFEKEKKRWQTGKLWSSPFISYLVKQKIKELAERKRGIVFQGSPRTVEEGKEIIPLLEKLYGKTNIKIFLLELSIDQSIWRNSHRRICELMRHPILYNEETVKLTKCPLDGSKLIKRALDKPEIIKKRFEVYEEQTLPLLDYFEEKNFVVKKIKGEQSVADVFSDILKLMEND